MIKVNPYKPDLTNVMLKDYIPLSGRWDLYDIGNFLKQKYDYTTLMERLVNTSNDDELIKDFEENQKKIFEDQDRLAPLMDDFLPVEMSSHISMSLYDKEMELLALTLCFKYREYLTAEEEAQLLKIFPVRDEDTKNLRRTPKSCRITPFSTVKEHAELSRGKIPERIEIAKNRRKLYSSIV